MTDAPELKPCPFCGSDELSHGYQLPPECGLVQCHNCDAVVFGKDEADAIAKWNRRALVVGAPDGWMPIQSAPRISNHFIDLWAVNRVTTNGDVYSKIEGRLANCRWGDWSTGVFRWIDSGGNDIEFCATETDGDDTIVNERIVTHWRPLPEPPARSAYLKKG